jgi:hypothetical protein
MMRRAVALAARPGARGTHHHPRPTLRGGRQKGNIVNPSIDTVADGPYSHPTQPVRHSYPLSIQNSDLSTALSLLMRTLPYALARFGVLFGTSLATALWWLVTLGGASLLSRIHGILGIVWFFGCAFAYGYVWRTLVRYFLYLLKAGHIAVLTELISKGSIGDGHEHMFAYGKRVVTQRFGQMNVMFALDLLVGGIVAAFNRTLDWIASLLPVPGLRDVTGLVNQVVRSATTFIDETILSYSLARGDNDVYRASRDGIIYYAQNSQDVLKTGLWIVVLDKVSMVLTWLVMLLPAILIGMVLPDSIKGAGILFTLLLSGMFAWAVRGAFLQPLFLTMIMIKFHVCVQGQAIEPEWDEQLSRISGKFVELKSRIGQPLETSATTQPTVTA